MAIKLNKEESTFRNEMIFTADAKALNIDNILVNVFMLLRHDGNRPKQRARAGASSFIDLDTIKRALQQLEKSGELNGFSDNQEAAELWIRSNLVNMVYRGNLDKEKISSLRPIHLESYRVRNATNTRDYSAADQVYLMLSLNSKVRDDLKAFLLEGWDTITEKINPGNDLDVDSLGLLHIIKNFKPGFLDTNSSLKRILPLLPEDAELYCDDVRRLLVYKRLVPRNVLIDYLKTITSFHLSIYIQKLIYTLPKMVESGTKMIDLDWSIVLDATDNFESKVSNLSIDDAEDLYNRIFDYVEASFKINMMLEYSELSRDDSQNIQKALEKYKDGSDDQEIYFKMKFNSIYKNLDQDDQFLVDDITKFEQNYFDKYLSLILNVKANRQVIEHRRMIANLSQNNSDRGFMAQGRSKKHPRRFVLGTRLLETLVQILVLESDGKDFHTKSLSIEELIQKIRDRYGLIINGLSEDRFKDADLNTHLAFKENVEAFKLKLRQIGFYNDLSDAYILQRIRPRYELNAQ